jgi:hypothetical protein
VYIANSTFFVGGAMLEFLKEFNSHYANAAQVIVTVGLAWLSWMYYTFYKEAKLNQGDAASMVKPAFWSIGTKYRILNVVEQIPSPTGPGYEQVSANQRRDLWEKLIRIESCLGIRHRVVPFDSKKCLIVIISRDGKEPWKSIHFNVD